MRNRSFPVLCSDGTVRRATWTGEADTFFSRPARVTVNGRTVRGTAYVGSDFFIGEDMRAHEHPRTDADLIASDGTRTGRMLFVGRGVNAHLTGDGPV